MGEVPEAGLIEDGVAADAGPAAVLVLHLGEDDGAPVAVQVPDETREQLLKSALLDESQLKDE